MLPPPASCRGDFPESDRLEGLNPPAGYMLGEDQQVEDVFGIEAELLRSEGIDPAWPRLVRLTLRALIRKLQG
jgi:hypothetical protein